MNTVTLRIGFVGAGANTRAMHLPGFRQVQDLELAVVANRTRESSERVAAQEGIWRVADHWSQVIDDPSIMQYV